MLRARHFLAAVLLALGCRDRLASTPAMGTLERDRIDLVAESNEPIVEFEVEEGAQVEAGAVILRLDPARLRAELERSAGQLEQARARLAELERGPRAEDIAAARARVAGAQGALALAARELRRAQSLFESGVRSRAELDAAEEKNQAALALRDEARAALDAALAGTTREELEQARSAVAALEAAQRETGLRVERLTVRAPVPGRVDALPFKLGERPPTGAVVAVLLARGAPYARVYVPEPLRAHIAEGSRARVLVPGLSREFPGHVRVASSEALFTPYFALTQHDRSRLAYVAEIDLEGDDARQLPTGLPVEVHFELGTSLAGPGAP